VLTLFYLPPELLPRPKTGNMRCIRLLLEIGM
jgi:hypothetical protein